MSENRNQFSLARAASIRGGAVKRQIPVSLNWSFALVVLFSLLFISPAQAQSIYTHWLDKTGGTAPESSLGAAEDLGTNVYLVGRYFAFSDQIGSTLLTNLIGVSNIFVACFGGNSTTTPKWAKSPVTDCAISNARIGSDLNGNIVVSGSYGGTNLSFGTTSITNYGTPGDYSQDIFIARFNSAGTLSSLVHIGGSADDVLGDLAVDGSFNMSGFYVTGSFQSTNFAAGGKTLARPSTSGWDCFAAQYNSSGNIVWLNQGTNAIGSCIAFDSASNCYVGGTVLGTASFGGLSPANQTTTNFLVKYNNAGTLIWVRGDMVIGNRIDVDQVQNIYTAGTFSNAVQIGGTTLSNNSPATIFVAKYDSNGNPLWAQPVPGLGDDQVTGMVIDAFTNCWISGYFASTNQTDLPVNSVAAIACFDPSGNLVALSQVSGAQPSMASAVVNSPLNNICISGSFATNFFLPGRNALTNVGNYDVFAGLIGVGPTIKLATTGTNVVCSWPTAIGSGFALQSLTNFSSTNWTTIGSGNLVNGQMVVTNAVSGSAQFFRLMRTSP